MSKSDVNTLEAGGASRDRLLYLLKTRGALSAQQLAAILGLTSMGARKQLELAAAAGLVQCTDKRASAAGAAGKGRPGREWSLTDAGHARFPDRHGDVLVQLLVHMREQLGESGIEQLITARERQMAQSYATALAGHNTLAEKLAALTAVRTQEGYMAELKTVVDGWELIEHHCPICAAATQCQAFCRSELELFRKLLPELNIARSEHLLSAGTRCVYIMREP